MRTSGRSMRLFRTLVWIVPVLCGACGVSAAIEPDFLMDSDPKLHVPQPVANFNPALKTLWIEALERPEIDLQRMAAETIARGHEYGIPDLIEAVPALERILSAETSHPASRFAAARALIALDSRNSSEKLFAAAQAYGSDLRQLVEPVLAAWEYRPANPVWIERLDSSRTRRRELVLAMRGLARVREPSARPQLLHIANDITRDPDLRLEAASAAGQTTDSGLEAAADRLAHDSRTLLFVNQLCAVRLLSRHTTESAQRLLIELAGCEEPVVAAAALVRLNEIDSALVLPLAESAMNSRDEHVRLQGAAAYVKLPTPDRIAPLGQLLADAHPDVRREVCQDLFRLSEEPELAEPIRGAALQVLAGDRWQGQEQAALLLGALEHQPAANRLVELLPSPRTEVGVAAAWALRKAAVPETIPALIDQAQRQTERRQRDDVPGVDDQVAHLFEALGLLKANDAVPLLIQYIPKRLIMGERSRSAAIWALGKIFEGNRNSEVEEKLIERITDFNIRTPERPIVKQMSAIALARMNAVDQAPMIRQVALKIKFPIQLAVGLRWALKELTGEDLPPPEPSIIGQGDWFLEPAP